MSTRKKLVDGGSIVGSWINSGSPIVAELMSHSGFDFLCVDVEHSAVDLPQVQVIFQAMRSGNPDCAPFVRLHGTDYAFVKRYLDAGARGLIAPLVRTRAEAELLVQAAKYPPEGLRGVGFCRANMYGANLKEECATANEEIVLAVQIEHIDAVDNIDEILTVAGIDAAFIGPYDLSASMGITAQFDHPDYLAARDRILAACQKHNVAPGIHVVPPDAEQVKDRMEEGYRLIAYSLDITMLAEMCKNGVEALIKG